MNAAGKCDSRTSTTGPDVGASDGGMGQGPNVQSASPNRLGTASKMRTRQVGSSPVDWWGARKSKISTYGQQEFILTLAPQLADHFHSESLEFESDESCTLQEGPIKAT